MIAVLAGGVGAARFLRALMLVMPADEIAAVNLRRHRCFVNDARCRARLAHARVFGDRDNARQAQRRVTAQLRIDQMRRNYAGLFAAEAKAL